MVGDLFIPVVGMAPDDVTLVSWFKQPGDSVSSGEVVALVETSKAELEIVSDSAGILGPHLVADLERVAPGSTIATVLGEGEAIPDASVPGADAGLDVSRAGAAEGCEATTAAAHSATVVDGAVGPGASDEGPATHPAGDAQASTAAGSKPASHTGFVGNDERTRHERSPRARRLAAEAAAATGAEAASLKHAAADADPPDTEVSAVSPASMMRHQEAVAAAVSRSWQEIPHFAVTRELRVDGLVATGRDLRAVLSQITLTDLLLRALALSFVEREGRTDLDVGLAVAAERGVTIPVLRDVPRLDLVQLVAARRAAVDRARAARLHPDDGRTPITTLSNLGAVGVDQFTGIVPYGQTSLLTVGRASPRPVVDRGRLAVATTMQATLNVDHRTWDGLHAGQLLDRLARLVSSPGLLANLGPLTATRPSTTSTPPAAPKEEH